MTRIVVGALTESSHDSSEVLLREVRIHGIWEESMGDLTIQEASSQLKEGKADPGHFDEIIEVQLKQSVWSYLISEF